MNKGILRFTVFFKLGHVQYVTNKREHVEASNRMLRVFSRAHTIALGFNLWD